MQFVSEQIKRCLEISTDVHKPLHLILHQLQTQIEGNFNDIIQLPRQAEKEKDVLGAMHPK